MPKRTLIVFAGSMLFVTAIWIINYQWYDISGDTMYYAALGRSLWETGRYSVDGTTPYAFHLPWLPLTSYPFTYALGANAGMKLIGLLAGFIVFFLTYNLLKRFFPQTVALAVVALLALHHSFNYLILGGGTDLHYAVLFLSAIIFLHKGLTESPRWYLLMGVFMGLACLARYNGVFLFPLAIGAILVQKRSLRLPWQFAAGIALGVGIFSLWLLRNYFVFGSPFYSEYRDQLSADYLDVIKTNIIFYLNPLHNVLPILFVCLIVGLWKHWRGRSLLLWTAAAAAALTMIWTTPSMRFVFPAFPILLAFAAWGAWDLVQLAPKKWQPSALVIGIALLLVTHLSMLCIYTVSMCNAWYDREIGLFIPPEIPLTIEPRFSIAEAKHYINQAAPPRSQVLVVDQVETFSYERGVFRSDIIVTHETGAGCPVYQIVKQEDARSPPIFTSTNKPIYVVERLPCT